MARCFFDLGWVRRLPTNRAVRMTQEGEQAFLKGLGLHLVDGKEPINI